MGEHYRKKHPSAMKRRKSRKESRVYSKTSKGVRDLINEIESKLEELEDRTR